jgi:protein-S-isoprenylcysteine O-methyltransferase Ste14
VNSAELRRVPPLGWVAAGLLTQKLLPGGRRPSRTSRGLAGVIAVWSLGLLAWSVTAFRRHETTVDPLAPERASRLVSDGPFQVTRNPMYVAMAGVLVAHAIARRSPVGLIPAAGFVLLINKAQIEAEERAMAANFGPEWDQYVAATPRWLSLRSLPNRKSSA